jgi:uncharacterized membrane protein YdjX (TVP38/TMEM64 family)
MVQFLHVHGFYGVLALSSWPNIAFDLCGICCGHYLMPFWDFFLATLIGKAVVRNAYQSVVYVALCSEAYLETMITCLQVVSPDAFQVCMSSKAIASLGLDTLIYTSEVTISPLRLSSYLLLFYS